MRHALRLAFALLLPACHGYLEVDSQVDPGPGGGPSECDPLVDTADDGHHNSGMDCLPCHNGTTATAFSTGGTLYDDLVGTNPIPGVSVHVVDATGKDVVMVSTLNGNFWSVEPLTYPLTTYASGCPDDIAMVTDVQSNTGCNSASCHGPTFRVYLP